MTMSAVLLGVGAHRDALRESDSSAIDDADYTDLDVEAAQFDELEPAGSR